MKETHSKKYREYLEELEAAIAEGEADIAAGRFIRITSDEELDAFFDALFSRKA